MYFLRKASVEDRYQRQWDAQIDHARDMVVDGSVCRSNLVLVSRVSPVIVNAFFLNWLHSPFSSMTMAAPGSKKRTLALVGIVGSAAFLAATNANLSLSAGQYLLAHVPSGAASFRDSRVGRSLFADIPPGRRLSASGEGRRSVSRRLDPVASDDLIREKLRRALYMSTDFATTSAETRRLYSAEDEQAAADQDYGVQLADVGMSIPDLALPPVLSQNLANVNENSNIRATPLFWHVPK